MVNGTAGLLESDAYFTCRLNCRMPKATCITRQTRGITYYGHVRHVPQECQDCATGQTIIKNEKENKMEQTDKVKPKGTRKGYQKTAPCENCGRNLPLQGKGLCGGCRAVTKTTSPEQLAAALAAAKIRFNSPAFDGKHRGWRNKLPIIPAATGGPDLVQSTRLNQPRGETPETVITAHDPNINLVFPSHDRPLYDAILAVARRNRRDPDQQILWTLQREITGEMEKSDAYPSI